MKRVLSEEAINNFFPTETGPTTQSAKNEVPKTRDVVVKKNKFAMT